MHPIKNAEKNTWPRITIVTPSFNQGQFLEKTILSIHNQKYPNLEHMVIDGGSTDNSVGIIHKYEKLFSFWISEPDRGQTHAINKGLEHATGEIFNWINSDDCMTEGSLFEIARLWQAFQPHLLVGAAEEEDLKKELHHRAPKISGNIGKLLQCWNLIIPQPSTFLHCDTVKRFGGLREDLNLRFDWEFYLRMRLELGKEFKIVKTPKVLSKILIHPNCKSARSEKAFQHEAIRIWNETSQKVGALNRFRAARYVDYFRGQSLIHRINRQKRATQMLLMTALRHPHYLTFRYFWGALRRAWASRVLAKTPTSAT